MCNDRGGCAGEGYGGLGSRLRNRLKKGNVRSDSAAAIGIDCREHIGGRCRHINFEYYLIQERVQKDT